MRDRGGIATLATRQHAQGFQDRVYVPHAFQKKPKKGIATPQPDIDLLKQRLARAAALHATQEY